MSLKRGNGQSEKWIWGTGNGESLKRGIFKSGNEETENRKNGYGERVTGNGEWGIFKSGNL